MTESTLKPDITYTSESGRKVEMYGIPSTQTFAEIFMRLIDIRLKKQAQEIAAKDRETEVQTCE